MTRSKRITCVLAVMLLGAGMALAARATRLVVRGPDGSVLMSVDASGRIPWSEPGQASLIDAGDSPGPVRDTASAPRSVCTEGDPGCRIRRHQDAASARVVLEDGAITALDGSTDDSILTRETGIVPIAGSLAGAATVDRMTTSTTYSETFTPGGSLFLAGYPDVYHLSDGSQWSSGAGSFRTGFARLDHVEVSGTLVRYVLAGPADGVLLDYSDFDSGQHSSAGKLGVLGPLVIEAVRGEQTAVLRGRVEILSNTPNYYGDLFNTYSAIVGAVVPLEVTYRLFSATWTETTFSNVFAYTVAGSIDFANPVSVPLPASLEIKGSSQVPAESTATYSAVVTYDNGVRRNVSAAAVWSVSPSDLAGIEGGVLTTMALPGGSQDLDLHATYEENGVVVEASRRVLCVSGILQDPPERWEMYQANSRHTGYRPLSLEVESFRPLWQKAIAPGYHLNPVTAAEGRVFVSLVTYFDTVPSLFALDARDGRIIWTKAFGRVFSVNPPSHAYGNVYIQTGNHGDDTWLHAYDAASGQVVFESRHEAQWERYFAPTIHDGVVFVNGGYYGGMYAFDAFSGEMRWFRALEQYDEWTPAVDANHAYAYAGRSFSVIDRETGIVLSSTYDSHFSWNGYDMKVAPVLGELDNALAIQGGRLISFSTLSRTIQWEIAGGYVGQPSVAAGVVYAIRNGSLDALDERTGARLWSWQPAGASLAGSLIITESHALASSGTTTFAVDLRTRSLAWSYPAGGHLALAEDTLYIASSSGTLTAISMPGYGNSKLLRMEIGGPSRVVEKVPTAYSALVYFDDGRIRDRTLMAQWWVEPGDAAAIDDRAVLTAGEALLPISTLDVHARYTERGMTVESARPVEVAVGIPLAELIRRNVRGAIEFRKQALAALAQADLREAAARTVLNEAAGDDASTNLPESTPAIVLARNRLVQAWNWGRLGQHALTRSLIDLQAALDLVSGTWEPQRDQLQVIADP